MRNWVQEEYTTPIHDKFSHGIDSQGFRLTVFKAQGGTVIETNLYDTVKDRHYQSLYVVTDQEDLGQELGKIITMENLRA